jgi:hypothetical protein
MAIGEERGAARPRPEGASSNGVCVIRPGAGAVSTTATDGSAPNLMASSVVRSDAFISTYNSAAQFGLMRGVTRRRAYAERA